MSSTVSQPAPNYAYIEDVSPNNSRRPIRYKYNPQTDCIGEGGFGTVYKVTRESPTSFPASAMTYALKCIKKENIKSIYEGEQQAREEIRIHRQLKHENICKFEHSFEDKYNIYILLEYCHDYSLHDYLRKRKRLKEIEVRFFMFQVLKAMLYLLKYKIVHKDLTLSNIFLTNNKQLVKIGDFGLSYQEKGEFKQGYICGTNGYLPPEAIYNTIAYTSAIDVYAFGICIYVLLTGKKLFKKNHSSVYEKIEERKIPYDKYTFFSKEVKDLMDRIFTLEKERIDFYDIYQHPFFNKGNGLDRVVLPILNLKGISDEHEVEVVKRKFDSDLKQLLLKVPMGVMRSVQGKGKYKNNSNNSSSKAKIKFENKQKVVLYNTEQQVMPSLYFPHVIVEETELNADEIENPEMNTNNTNNNSVLTNSEYDDIPNTFTNINIHEYNEEEAVINNDVHIEYFRDCKSEHGLLYVLSNGVRCFLFKDNSTLVCVNANDKEQQHFLYIMPSHKAPIHFTDVSDIDHNNHLNISKAQLAHAINHMSEIAFQHVSSHFAVLRATPYITKWKLTSLNTYIFILSNNSIECFCEDNTVIIFCSDASTSLKYIKYSTAARKEVVTIPCGKTFTAFACTNMIVAVKINQVIKEILDS